MTRLACVAFVVLALVSAAAADKKFKLDGHKLVVPGPIVYETGKPAVKSDSDPTLVHVKKYLDAKKAVTMLRIEVHSDSRGSESHNLKLSAMRALAVARILVERGVDCKRLIAVGFGERKPVGDNKTPAGREANRRTDFVNATLNDKPIDDAPIDGGGTVAGDPCD
jgi:OOP family OmpA-OmpF porin